MKLELPSYGWLIQPQGKKYITNDFTGSCRTDPTKGCGDQTMYNYKLHVDLSEPETPLLIAECYWQLSLMQGAKKQDQQRREYPCTEEGLAQASEWLISEMAKGDFRLE